MSRHLLMRRPASAQKNSAAVTVIGNSVQSNLQVQNNTGATTVDNNTVTGNPEDRENTALTQVFTNTVGGNLQCQNDTSISGGNNAVAQQKQRQCALF